LEILKISDFGISNCCDLRKTKTTATLGGETTPAYIAPEIIMGFDGTYKVDIWALGVILY
jgi:serine/threonine protein kinase